MKTACLAPNIALLLVSLLSLPPALAEAPKHHRAGSATKFINARLPYVPNMRCMPQYTGQTKLEQSVYYPNLDKGSSCYVLNYLAKEEPADVCSWYASSLKASGWQVDLAKGGMRVSGRLAAQGLFTIISVGKASEKGYKTALQVRYIDFGKVPGQQPETAQ